MPDICIPEQGLSVQFKHFVDCAAIETLIAVPQTDGYGASGQFFSALDNARMQLINAQSQVADVLRTFAALFQAYQEPQVQQISSVLTFEQLLAVFNQQPRFPCLPPVGMLRVLLDGQRIKNLLRRVYARMAKVQKVTGASRPRFCGLSWSRRLWFLLHGSHPPKTECCPAFGGA
jgi:hypothetical protein